MAYLEKESQESQVFERPSRRLGGLVLIKEQKEVITLLLQGKDVLAVLPTGFGKSLIYQSFVLVKQMENESTSGRDRPSCFVIVPLRSIGEEQINSNDFDLSVKGFEKTVDVLNEMKNNKNFKSFMLPLRKLCRETSFGCCGMNPRDNCHWYLSTKVMPLKLPPPPPPPKKW